MEFRSLVYVVSKYNEAYHVWMADGLCAYAVLKEADLKQVRDLDLDFDVEVISYALLVWSANPKHPVREGAMLVLDAQNGWILQDVDKTVVWNTPKLKSISILLLKDIGNLVLCDAHHSPIWESFSYPSDSLLPGQNLTQGPANKLIPTSPFTDTKI
ncbi:bulb-type lectin domain-containing protein [Artemisia annua]|uniref:Bulb-type lectin domain-containing protein n=1 Tax=Artemisia annua TaxID=35608 RepID=A0A2U1P9L9_ARTAN|nr:bulb-type lectin domain-containing protein [Artemisia annua]